MAIRRRCRRGGGRRRQAIEILSVLRASSLCAELPARAEPPRSHNPPPPLRTLNHKPSRRTPSTAAGAIFRSRLDDAPRSGHGPLAAGPAPASSAAAPRAAPPARPASRHCRAAPRLLPHAGAPPGEPRVESGGARADAAAHRRAAALRRRRRGAAMTSSWENASGSSRVMRTHCRVPNCSRRRRAGARSSARSRALGLVTPPELRVEGPRGARPLDGTVGHPPPSRPGVSPPRDATGLRELISAAACLQPHLAIRRPPRGDFRPHAARGARRERGRSALRRAAWSRWRSRSRG